MPDWKISSKDGIYTASQQDLERWIETGIISWNDKISRDGERWIKISQSPEFSHLRPSTSEQPISNQVNTDPQPSPISYQPFIGQGPPASTSGVNQPVLAPYAQLNYGSPQGSFRCPCCSSSYLLVESKVSAAGWVVFIILFLFLCWPLCWLGLLIKEDVRKCGSCGFKVG